MAKKRIDKKTIMKYLEGPGLDEITGSKIGEDKLEELIDSEKLYLKPGIDREEIYSPIIYKLVNEHIEAVGESFLKANIDDLFDGIDDDLSPTTEEAIEESTLPVSEETIVEPTPSASEEAVTEFTPIEENNPEEDIVGLDTILKDALNEVMESRNEDKDEEKKEEVVEERGDEGMKEVGMWVIDYTDKEDLKSKLKQAIEDNIRYVSSAKGSAQYDLLAMFPTNIEEGKKTPEKAKDTVIDKLAGKIIRDDERYALETKKSEEVKAYLEELKSNEHFDSKAGTYKGEQLIRESDRRLWVVEGVEFFKRRIQEIDEMKAKEVSPEAEAAPETEPRTESGEEAEESLSDEEKRRINGDLLLIFNELHEEGYADLRMPGYVYRAVELPVALFIKDKKGNEQSLSIDKKLFGSKEEMKAKIKNWLDTIDKEEIEEDKPEVSEDEDRGELGDEAKETPPDDLLALVTFMEENGLGSLDGFKGAGADIKAALKYKGEDLAYYGLDGGLFIQEVKNGSFGKALEMLKDACEKVDKALEEEKAEDDKKYMTLRDFVEMSVMFYEKTGRFNTFVLNGVEVNLKDSKYKDLKGKDLVDAVLNDCVGIVDKTHEDVQKRRAKESEERAKREEKKNKEKKPEEEKKPEDEKKPEEDKKPEEEKPAEEKKDEAYFLKLHHTLRNESKKNIATQMEEATKTKASAKAKSDELARGLIGDAMNGTEEFVKKAERLKANYETLIQYEDCMATLRDSSKSKEEKEKALETLRSMKEEDIKAVMKFKEDVTIVTALDELTGVPGKHFAVSFATSVDGEYVSHDDMMNTYKAFAKEHNDNEEMGKKLLETDELIANISKARNDWYSKKPDKDLTMETIEIKYKELTKLLKEAEKAKEELEKQYNNAKKKEKESAKDSKVKTFEKIISSSRVYVPLIQTAQNESKRKSFAERVSPKYDFAKIERALRTIGHAYEDRTMLPEEDFEKYKASIEADPAIDSER